ncbi:histidine phosphatase family protein [Pontibacter flavimaris]|uniref:Histidine phosphatase family protein n=1 Tax=Pontibacter flavimaris TaxID=1797110 RepID=A0A1Q5PC72_9BACT|nr:histidine phosphatase family protein [Pontibacter flavimaris]OKL39836.1 histidine phosphatase family protein [Pontibacter flavimaris]
MIKPLLKQLSVFFLLLVAVACQQAPVGQEGALAVVDPVDNNTQPTVVYLVRHAEKDISDINNQDPDLTPEGKARAEALRELLKQEQVDALYATKYIRTKNTLKPLAEERQLEVLRYEANDFIGLKNRILENHQGQTVVVSGHSNTLLPILEAFGANRPVPDISEQEYDYLFKVTLSRDGTATLETDRFGVN